MGIIFHRKGFHGKVIWIEFALRYSSELDSGAISLITLPHVLNLRRAR